MKYSLLQPLKLDQRKCTESRKPTQKAAPPMFVPHIIVTEVQILKQHVLASSHIAQLSTPLTALESSGGNRTGLVSSTLPLIIPALRGLKRSAERWSGGKSTAVRSVCRCRSSLLAAAAEEASAAVMGSEERGKGERWAGDRRGRGRKVLMMCVNTLTRCQNTPIQQYFLHVLVGESLVYCFIRSVCWAVWSRTGLERGD